MNYIPQGFLSYFRLMFRWKILTLNWTVMLFLNEREVTREKSSWICCLTLLKFEILYMADGWCMGRMEFVSSSAADT